MKTRQRYRKDDIRAALETARGNMSHAARIVGCNRATIAVYLERYPDLEAIREQGYGEIVDLAENKLLAAINRGDLRAVMFALRSQPRWAEHRSVDMTTQGEKLAPVVVMPSEVFGSIEEAAEAARNKARNATDQDAEE